MIAVDTSSIIAYLRGDLGEDVEMVDHAITGEVAVLPPVVLSEFLSDPRLPFPALVFACRLPRLDAKSGYWERTGRLRATMISKGWNVSLADTLIAQSCLDHDVSLVTRDKGFKAFEKYAGLRLR